MSNKNGKVNVEKLLTLTKNDVKKYVKQKLRQDCPDNLDKVTNRMLLESLIYLQGYADAIEGDMQPPINRQEMDSFFLDKAYKHIIKKLPQAE